MRELPDDREGLEGPEEAACMNLKTTNRERVLFLDVRDQMGGDTVVLLSTLRHLSREQFEIHVACLPHGRLRQALDDVTDLHVCLVDFGTRAKYLERKGLAGLVNNLASFLKMLKAITSLSIYVRRHGIKLIHTSNTLRAAFTSWVVSRLAHCKYVYHAHCGPSESSLHRWLVRSAARVVAVSNFTKACHLQAGIEEDKVDVCYNGVDTNKFFATVPPEQTLRELGIRPGLKVIGLVGRLSPLKGHEDLLFAIPKVLAFEESSIFVFVGDDSIFDSNENYLDRLKNLTARLELEDHVIFTGFRPDTQNIYACLDVVVAPSHEEAFGMVVLEGMAMGKPVVASSVGGVPEVLTPEAGILVPPKNPSELARAIIQVLADPDGAKRMAEQARARARERFTINHFVQGLEKSLHSAASLPRT